jgi:hypothetical protein
MVVVGRMAAILIRQQQQRSPPPRQQVTPARSRAIAHDLHELFKP